MKVRHPKKLAILIVVFLGLGAALLAQALSGTTAKRAPSVAVSLMPGNGEAIDRLAFANYALAAGTSADAIAIAQASKDAQPMAKEALALEPLLMRSLTIVGLAQSSETDRAKILRIADGINRRDVPLQAVRLGHQVALEDFEGVFVTADRILRVDPDLSEQFFPVLINAFRAERGVASLNLLAEDGAPWLEEFLKYAVRQDGVLTALAEFRGTTRIENEDFDQKLIEGLVGQGSYAEARAVYTDLKSKAEQPQEESGNPLGWSFGYPPIDWFLADRSGFRAQPSRRGEGLDINVAAGKDGVLAERVIDAPAGPFRINVRHDLGRRANLQYVRLMLHCGNREQPFLNEALTSQSSSFPVSAAPDGCDDIHTVIYARVFTTEAPVRGTISAIELVAG